MISEFIDSWDLFHNVYLTGWLIGLLLSLVGVVVVARDQIFLSAAVSQASTLGIALGLWMGNTFGSVQGLWLRADNFISFMAVTFAVIAALVTTRSDGRVRESAEAITGWVFLLSASLAILILAHSPHGLDEIHRLLSSSIIGATVADVVTFGILLVVTALLIAVTYRRILLFTLDPVLAMAVGMKLQYWRIVTATWLGLTVGLSMRASGMLYTFGCLVLPALVAKNLSREIRSVFLLSPLVALVTGTIGFVLANHYDYPPAQMAVVLLCLSLALAWASRWLRHVG